MYVRGNKDKKNIALFSEENEEKMTYAKDCHFCYEDCLLSVWDCHITFILLLIAIIIHGTYCGINRHRNVVN